MELSEKAKSILVGVGLGIFIGLQANGSIPGFTDQGITEENIPKILGIGAAIGFFIGLANLSRANPNPHKLAAFVACFVACFVAGVVALIVNLHRGYISSDFEFNFVAIAAAAYLPTMVLGGVASLLFSKNA